MMYWLSGITKFGGEKKIVFSNHNFRIVLIGKFCLIIGDFHSKKDTTLKPSSRSKKVFEKFINIMKLVLFFCIRSFL